ncbi:MAG: DNA double-strand break repair nuclease NurA [Candidatus Micrarchaeia archaeon]
MEDTVSEDKDDYKSIEGIVGVDEAIAIQNDKLNKLREDVKTLQFKRVDIAGDYSSITYKAIDGGKMKVYFNPFEINVIDVADSNGQKKLSFVYPEIDEYDDNSNSKEATKGLIQKIDSIPLIAKFVTLLKSNSITEISSIFNSSSTLMEIGELACIFDRITADSDDPIIIMKDGLLRTKALKSNKNATYIPELLNIIKQKKKFVKLVGVSKTSAVVSLLSTALFLEKKIPSDAIGYVKIPLALELKAYEWNGSGKADKSNDEALTYAFGELYIAKLAVQSNLLVTIEIPKDLKNKTDIYTEEEIIEIISYLAKDSKHSYPVIGYPQTIMRAHETAVQLGFPISIIREEIKDKILKRLDPASREFVRDGWLLTDLVDKGVLGGGKNG